MRPEPAMNPILVTGGTGTLGRLVVAQLLDAGHEVRVVSRRARHAGRLAPSSSMAVDLRGGEGIDAAVAGVEAIIHCATSARGDVQAARNLIAAARRADVPGLAYISIVGVDRVPLRYYRAKLEVERLIRQSGLEWTILRTTQFHELVLRLAKASARLPVMLVPAGTSVQPIDAGEVAAPAARYVLRSPLGGAAATVQRAPAARRRWAEPCPGGGARGQRAHHGPPDDRHGVAGLPDVRRVPPGVPRHPPGPLPARGRNRPDDRAVWGSRSRWCS
jgi:uncharacterized protein YbjT (DUF2867 family)